jgi:glucan phosphoethanolaminetransferase (alkaline phosphatase superfamily)
MGAGARRLRPRKEEEMIEFFSSLPAWWLILAYFAGLIIGFIVIGILDEDDFPFPLLLFWPVSVPVGVIVVVCVFVYYVCNNLGKFLKNNW